MITEKIFEILEITDTKDEDLIREAYRRKLISVNPEDNPEGFKRLREAYEAALKYAAQTDEATQEKPTDPVSLYIERVDHIYRSLSKRLDIAQWETLLKDELLDDLDLGEDAKWGLFRYMANNYKVPTSIWRLLDHTFHIKQDQQRFKEHLPINFVDFILWSCTEDAQLSEFPLHQLTGSDTADYDEFLHQLDALTSLASREAEYEDRSQWLKEQEQKIAFLDTLGISHPYYELEKARYAMEIGQMETALQTANALLSPDTEDARLLLCCARIFRRCGRENDAEQIYHTFLAQEEPDDQEHEIFDTPKQKKNQGPHRDSDIYAAAIALADILLGRKEYVQAREYAIQAIDIYHTEEAIQILTDCGNAIIDQMTGESASEKEFSVDDGLRLADCYIETNRAAEGMAYFEEHPLLTEDTVKCHRTKALLFHSGAKHEEALEETLLWRKSLEADPKADPSKFVRNYVLEAQVREQIYDAFKDKQSQDALAHKKAAFAAFEEAFRLMPEDAQVRVNAMISKVMFLRTLWEYEPSKDYYQEAATLCEEIKELDSGYYWAYHYAQAAYEGLGNAQKVVDYFYEAKRIYAGMPEIYERAAKVFQSYEQWNDLENILKQAEESGVESDSLKVIKMELVRVKAESEQELLQAEAYCKSTIDILEEKLEKETSAMDEYTLNLLKKTLAEAYRQRALLHDDNENIKNFKNLDDIEKWLNRSLELHDMYSNRYFLGYFYLYEKVNHEEAYKHLKVCEKIGTSHWVFHRIALCHEHWAQWDEAIKYYKKGAELAPDNDDYLWRIGWLYRRKFIRTGQKEYYAEALKYLDMQMERFGEHPMRNWEIWWQYSDLHARNGEYELALSDIEREILTNNRGRNWGHKAYLLELLGRHQEAFPIYEKSIEISRKNKADYDYSYTQIYKYFCRNHAYKDGLSWFETNMEKLLTEEQRKTNLGHILNYHLMLENWQDALDTLEKIYGSITLKNHVCASWKEEGDRINDLLDAYQYWLSDEELRQKAEEAAALLESNEALKAGNEVLMAGDDTLKADNGALRSSNEVLNASNEALKTGEDPETKETEEEIHSGKHSAYWQIAYCYTDYLFDDETGLIYLQKSLEHIKLAGDENDSDDFRGLILDIMGCLWRMGRTQEAAQYRTMYMESLTEDFEECAELKKNLEILYEQSSYARNNQYSLFKLALFCGEYEKAAEKLKQMDCAGWCWHCREKDCTESWEARGYLALIRGQKEEAYRCFEKANECALTRNDEAFRELKRLRRESK